MSRAYIVQTCIVGSAGRNSLIIDTYCFRNLGNAKDFFAEAMVVNAEADPELATELLDVWEENGGDNEGAEALEWSHQGPRGSTISYRIECVEIE